MGVAKKIAIPTSTAKATPKKRGPKLKAVPYLKRVCLERKEKVRVAAKVAARRIAACNKLRGSSLVEHVGSLPGEIVNLTAAKNPYIITPTKTIPRRGTRSNLLKPRRDPKPIGKYVAEPAVTKFYSNRRLT